MATTASCTATFWRGGDVFRPTTIGGRADCRLLESLSLRSLWVVVHLMCACPMWCVCVACLRFESADGLAAAWYGIALGALGPHMDHAAPVDAPLAHPPATDMRTPDGPGHFPMPARLPPKNRYGASAEIASPTHSSQRRGLTIRLSQPPNASHICKYVS